MKRKVVEEEGPEGGDTRVWRSETWQSDAAERGQGESRRRGMPTGWVQFCRMLCWYWEVGRWE